MFNRGSNTNTLSEKQSCNCVFFLQRTNRSSLNKNEKGCFVRFTELDIVGGGIRHLIRNYQASIPHE